MSAPGSTHASPPRSAPKAAKKKATQVPPAHPPYVEMVRSAITALKERGGSSRQKIGQYIQANYKIGNEQTRINAHLRTSLKSGVEKGVLVHSAKGTGANGSFRVGKAIPEKKRRAASKKGKRRVKSPKKRRSPKKSTKKSASKKKPKKAAKKSTKKVRRSPAKKAKRSPKKKQAARRKPVSKAKRAKKAKR